MEGSSSWRPARDNNKVHFPQAQVADAASLFVRLISHQPAVLFSQNKSATSNQPAVLYSHNKSAPAISHQPNEQACRLWGRGNKEKKRSSIIRRIDLLATHLQIKVHFSL
jgi:hypothetical protein